MLRIFQVPYSRFANSRIHRIPNPKYKLPFSCSPKRQKSIHTHTHKLYTLREKKWLLRFHRSTYKRTRQIGNWWPTFVKLVRRRLFSARAQPSGSRVSLFFPLNRRVIIFLVAKSRARFFFQAPKLKILRRGCQEKTQFEHRVEQQQQLFFLPSISV